MVNRTKISKEIRRRTGGVGKTGNGTKVEDLKPKDWEQIPGTGGSPHNPPRFRLTAKAKKRQQTQFKLKQATEKEKVTKPAVEALYKGVKEGAPYARLTGAVRRGAEKTERERLRKAGSLDVGHPRTAVKRKAIGPPLGYKEAQAKAAKRAVKIKEEITMERVDPDKHKDLQRTIRRADRIAAEKLAGKKRGRELGEYNLLTWESKGGQPKRSKKKPTKIKKRPWKHPTRYAKAGGQVSYQGHDGNKVISKYYD